MRRPHEPSANSLARRYRYDPETGAIIGPRCVLKPRYNRGYYRVGVWHNGATVSVEVGRLAFAIQHGRWPVGIRHESGKTTDCRAVNLSETVSYRLHGIREARCVVRSYRGAWSGGRDVVHELARVRRLLAGDIPRRWDRVRLSYWERRFDAVLKPCRRAAAQARREFEGWR